MKQALYLICILTVVLASSCAERHVCPAYASAFIYDKDVLKKQFSTFGEDSLPKIVEVKKDQYLVGVRQPYKKKIRVMNNIAMEEVYPVLDDSLAFTGDALMLAEVDMLDSAALDSAKNELPWKEQFNVEQEYYFWYLNDILVYPEEKLMAVQKKSQLEDEKTSAIDVGDTGKKKKGLFGFLKRKKKNKNDSTATENVEGPVPNGADLEENPPKKKKKKKKKKEKKKKNKDAAPKDTPPAKEEEPDDDSGDDDF